MSSFLVMTSKKEFPITFSEPLNGIVSMDVNDLDRAIDFYSRILGFEPSFVEAKEMGWVEIDTYVEGLLIGLNLTEEEIKPSSTGFLMSIENCDAAKEYLDAKGVKTTEIRDIPDMVSLFEFYDSEGNMISLAGKPRKSNK